MGNEAWRLVEKLKCVSPGGVRLMEVVFMPTRTPT